MPVSPNPLICALDTPDVARARALCQALAGQAGAVKLGLEFFTAHGPAGVRDVMEGSRLPLFLDLKFHDIPNTVAGAVTSAARLSPMFLTVHAAGGKDMLRAAVHAATEAAQKPRLLAITVLTSLDQDDLAQAGVPGTLDAQVCRLATLAREAGMDGVVCSPREIALLRRECGTDFLLVVPGIRPPGAENGDQKRVLTPRHALAEGADFLVIGRPITGAPDPAAAAASILHDLRQPHHA